jgi:hypothetical protein
MESTGASDGMTYLGLPKLLRPLNSMTSSSLELDGLGDMELNRGGGSPVCTGCPPTVSMMKEGGVEALARTGEASVIRFESSTISTLVFRSYFYVAKFLDTGALNVQSSSATTSISNSSLGGESKVIWAMATSGCLLISGSVSTLAALTKLTFEWRSFWSESQKAWRSVFRASSCSDSPR